MDLLKALPLYIAVPGAVILLGIVTVIITKALGQGREISFWPPRIGPRPSEPPEKEKPAKKTVAADISLAVAYQALLSSTQRQILDYIRAQNKKVSMNNINKQFDIGRSELFYRLEHLRLLGFIEGEEIDEGGVYYLSSAYKSELDALHLPPYYRGGPSPPGPGRSSRDSNLD